MTENLILTWARNARGTNQPRAGQCKGQSPRKHLSSAKEEWPKGSSASKGQKPDDQCQVYADDRNHLLLILRNICKQHATGSNSEPGDRNIGNCITGKRPDTKIMIGRHRHRHGRGTHRGEIFSPDGTISRVGTSEERSWGWGWSWSRILCSCKQRGR